MDTGKSVVTSNGNKNSLLHVLVQKFPVEIIPDGIIDEAFSCFRLTTSLILEYNIIIPPSFYIEIGWTVDIK